MEKKNWAIVDDDKVFHLTTQLLIEEKELKDNVLIFHNGKEAIEYIRSNKNSSQQLPDVILLDLYMPVMDGWDFLEEYLPLRNELGKDISIYVVSSSIDQDDLKRAYAISEIKNYFIKPLRLTELDKILSDLRAA
jgi:CheY-like chemotaxis protein